MVQLARERCTGIVHAKQQHTVAQLLAEYLVKVTSSKSMHSQRRDGMVLQRFTKRVTAGSAYQQANRELHGRTHEHGYTQVKIA
jgi:hypothetical protein